MLSKCTGWLNRKKVVLEGQNGQEDSPQALGVSTASPASTCPAPRSSSLEAARSRPSPTRGRRSRSPRRPWTASWPRPCARWPPPAWSSAPPPTMTTWSWSRPWAWLSRIYLWVDLGGRCQLGLEVGNLLFTLLNVIHELFLLLLERVELALFSVNLIFLFCQVGLLLLCLDSQLFNLKIIAMIIYWNLWVKCQQRSKIREIQTGLEAVGRVRKREGMLSKVDHFLESIPKMAN